jgi:hypothetical protein
MPSSRAPRRSPTATPGCTHVVNLMQSVVIGALGGDWCVTHDYKEGAAGLPQAHQLLPRPFHSVTRNAGRRAFGDPPMGRKPLGDRALSPADRQRRWRLRHPSAGRKRRQVQTASADDFYERQAVGWKYDWLIEELGAILERALFDDKQFVSRWDRTSH